MAITKEEKLQIFCAALTATILSDEASRTTGAGQGSGIGVMTSVEKAAAIANEASIKLNGWE